MRENISNNSELAYDHELLLLFDVTISEIVKNPEKRAQYVNFNLSLLFLADSNGTPCSLLPEMGSNEVI